MSWTYWNFRGTGYILHHWFSLVVFHTCELIYIIHIHISYCLIDWIEFNILSAHWQLYETICVKVMGSVGCGSSFWSVLVSWGKLAAGSHDSPHLDIMTMIGIIGVLREFSYICDGPFCSVIHYRKTVNQVPETIKGCKVYPVCWRLLHSFGFYI